MFRLCQGDITRKAQVRKMKLPELIEWTYLTFQHDQEEKNFMAQLQGAEIRDIPSRKIQDDPRPLAEIFAERLPRGANVGIKKIYVSKEELEKRKKGMN